MKATAWINKTGSHGYLEWDKDDEVDESIPLYQVKELSDEQIVFARMLAGDNLRDFVNAIIEKATS